MALNLSLDILPDNVESIAVWHSTKGHEGSPTAPPQEAHVVHGSNTSTSLKIALPDSSDPCQPYYIWVAGFVSNGQRGAYSKRRRVEVCSRADGMMYKTQYYAVIDDLVSFSLAKCIFWPIREEQFDSADEFNNVVTLGILGGLVHGCRYCACCCEDCVWGHGVEKVEKGQ